MNAIVGTKEGLDVRKRRKRRRNFRAELFISVFCVMGIVIFSFISEINEEDSSVDHAKMQTSRHTKSEELKVTPYTEISSETYKSKEPKDEKGEQDVESSKQEGEKKQDHVVKPTEDTREIDSKKDDKDSLNQVVYLTFDDGPHRVSTEILALLEQYGAKATFFMLDGNIHMYPEAVKQMAEAGHALGLHGVTHDKDKIYQSPQTVIDEMTQTQKSIKDITGIETTLIRTPYGSSPYMKDNYKKAVKDHGYQLWDWTIDSKDWFYRDERYIDSVIEQIAGFDRKTEPLVILLHERKETLEHLSTLLDYLVSNNYQFKSLDTSLTPVVLK